MLNDRNLEHPTVSHALRTGYPAQHKPLLCDTCKDEISSHETYGEFDGRIICTDCLEDEWKELTAKEKFERLGYDAKFNG